MENVPPANHPVTALLYTCFSVAAGIFASIAANVELFLRMGAAFAAICSAGMAVRYYYFATLEKKQSLKQSLNK